MPDERIVAVGFLTQRDLDALGSSFRRVVPVADDHLFDDLLARLDEIEATPQGSAVVLKERE